MRLVEMEPVHFSRVASLDAMVDAVYGDAAVKRVYGEDSKIGAWNDRGVRRLRLSLAKPQLTDGLMPLTAKIGATMTQRVVHDQRAFPRLHEVQGSIRLHMPFLTPCIKIRPKITLAEVPGKRGAEMRAVVEVHAIFPPPLNRLLEDAMAQTAAGELDRYVAALNHLR